MSEAPKLPTALHRLDNLLARLLGGLLPEERRYWILVPLAGACAGLLAVALVKLLAGVQALFWGDGQSLLRGAEKTGAAAWWLMVLIPFSGGALVAVAARLLGKEKGLTGNSALIESLAFKKGQLPLGRSLGGAVVSIAAVASGASLGREGALITSGAGIGSWIGGKLHLKEHHVKVLLACGAAGLCYRLLFA